MNLKNKLLSRILWFTTNISALRYSLIMSKIFPVAAYTVLYLVKEILFSRIGDHLRITQQCKIIVHRIMERSISKFLFLFSLSRPYHTSILEIEQG